MRQAWLQTFSQGNVPVSCQQWTVVEIHHQSLCGNTIRIDRGESGRHNKLKFVDMTCHSTDKINVDGIKYGFCGLSLII